MAQLFPPSPQLFPVPYHLSLPSTFHLPPLWSPVHHTYRRLLQTHCLILPDLPAKRQCALCWLHVLKDTEVHLHSWGSLAVSSIAYAKWCCSTCLPLVAMGSNASCGSMVCVTHVLRSWTRCTMITSTGVSHVEAQHHVHIHKRGRGRAPPWQMRRGGRRPASWSASKDKNLKVWSARIATWVCRGSMLANMFMDSA